MKTFIVAIIAFIAGAILVRPFLKHGENAEPPAAKEESAAVETNENGIVKLTLEKQTLIGLQVASPEAVEMTPEVTGFGRVIDPAGLIAAVSESEMAQAALNASKKEFDRLNILHQQNQNVSTRVLETAEAVLKRDQLAAEAFRLKILNVWGRVILDHSDLGGFVRSLAEQTNALVRIDLTLTDTLDVIPKEALLSRIVGEEPPVQGLFISRLSSVDPQAQGQSLLFLVHEKPGEWPIGSAVVAHLRKEGVPVRGFIVPRPAVIRSQGVAWIYTRRGPDAFMRSEIETDWPAAKGWFVTNGVAGTNKIVVQGAQIILSQELNASGQPAGLRD